MRLIEIQTTLKREIEEFPYPRARFTYQSSPLDFQKKSGIQVCQHYNMPDNLSVEEVYKYYSSVLRALDTRKIKRNEADNRMSFIYDSIERVNPELRTITSVYDNREGHITTAVLSLFNIDDIRAYVEEGKSGRWYLGQPDYEARYKKQSEIETLTGAPITWIMCNKTLDRVYAEVCKKYKNEIAK